MSHQPTYRSVHPVSGQEAATYPFISSAGLDEAMARADAAYAVWRTTSLDERVSVAHRIADLFDERAAQLAAVAEEEMGKPVDEGVEEAQFCAAIFRYYADHAAELLKDQPITTEAGGTAVVQRVSTGTILGVMPWNFPFYQVTRFVAPNLVLGNTLLLKHAESVPRSALAIADLFEAAGVPEGVYTNLFATHEQIAQIIRDDRVQGVSLTGSERAGAAVAALAGQALKKCVLELGGSDPLIALDGVDVASLAADAWGFRMYNDGQACNSNKRIIVQEGDLDEFVRHFTERATAVDAATWRPMASRKAAEDLDARVREAVEQGATLHAGGVLAEAPSAVYTPAVLTGVTPQMNVFHEELFGPVVVVYGVDDADGAVELANATRFGLGGSVFAGDRAEAERVASRIDSGMVNVNTISGEGAELPFGGTKRSGFGRELGALGIDEFANKRLMFVSSGD